jgi:hypothetical protein
VPTSAPTALPTAEPTNATADVPTSSPTSIPATSGVTAGPTRPDPCPFANDGQCDVKEPINLSICKEGDFLDCKTTAGMVAFALSKPTTDCSLWQWPHRKHFAYFPANCTV